MVTTFVVQTSQNLQVDYSQVTATLMFELIDVQRAAANGTLVNNVPRSNLTPFSKFRPTISDSLVNGLWFTSLSFSLATALFTVLTKQWIHQYVAVPSGTPRDRCRVRQFRYMGLEQWGVGFIIGLLPVLLSASLGIFLVGLVLFLAPLQVVIASVVGAITLISFSVYFVSNFLPIVYPSCPYKTPLSQYIFLSYAYIIHLITLVSSALTPSKSAPRKSAPRKFRDIEHAAVDLKADDLDVYALGWLSNMSSNPSVQNIVIQSTSALPLCSVEPLKQYTERFSEMFNPSVFDRMAITCQESIIDRLIRVTLRFSTWSVWLRRIDRPSTETYAEVLCIDYRNPSRPNEIANLVKAQFMEPPDKELCLQPIVWAHLLQELLPFTLESGLIPLFLMIPPDYWRADYKPPPLFPKNDMKIRSISDEDHRAVSLFDAVYYHLYPDIADALFEGFMHVEDSIFHPDPATDEFSAPQDARLRALLAMAGSPSIWKVPMPDHFGDSVFRTIMWNIGTYMDVGNLSLLDNDLPSFRLDSNCYSVLKLLYTLISSDEFGDASMCNLDQHIMLVTFLKVLSSTSPHPCFLPEDWCTPSMASNFAQIALQDTKTWRPSDQGSNELILYFLWFAPVVNQIFSHFVSGCHLDRIGRLRGVDVKINVLLSEILDTFIVRMTPDVLDHQVLQQFTAHIFEPENLFTICAVHICRNATHCLRRLTQVHPDHPAWPECLRKLDATPLAEHFDLLGGFPDWTGSIVSEFREFVEGGCVGSFGMQTPDPQPPQQAPVGDDHPVNERLLMKSLPKLWHRLRQRQHCDTVAKTEEIMMNPSSSISEV